jgi:hypothetical protein
MLPLKRFTSDSEAFHQLMANYGFTVYVAQLLEIAMKNLLITAEAAGHITIDRENLLRSQSEWLSDQCLGPMVKCLELNGVIDKKSKRVFHKALHQRNLVVHRFFEENMLYLVSEAGIAALNDRLWYLYRSLKGIHQEITDNYMQLAKQFGITEELLADRYKKLVAEANRPIDVPGEEA